MFQEARRGLEGGIKNGTAKPAGNWSAPENSRSSGASSEMTPKSSILLHALTYLHTLFKH
jgi:hypothetical protein